MTTTLFEKPKIIRKHFIVSFILILKFLFIFSIAMSLFWAVYYSKAYIWHTFWLFFLFNILIILNFWFLHFILKFIINMNDLFIIHKDKIIISQSSLIMQDDIEIIHSYAINKFKKNKHWIFQNMFKYWDIIIEQQNDAIKTIKYLPFPTNIIILLNQQEEYYSHERKWTLH